MIELLRYQRQNGQEPFTEWSNTILDKVAAARIKVRLLQLQAGNFGDCESVGNGVIELRVHIGAGYRVYCGRHGQVIVILLCGGTKRSQAADIKLAKQFWSEWKQRQR